MINRKYKLVILYYLVEFKVINISIERTLANTRILFIYQGSFYFVFIFLILLFLYHKRLVKQPETPVQRNIIAIPLPAPVPTAFCISKARGLPDCIKGSNTKSARNPPSSMPIGIVTYCAALRTANTLPCIPLEI